MEKKTKEATNMVKEGLGKKQPAPELKGSSSMPESRPENVLAAMSQFSPRLEQTSAGRPLDGYLQAPNIRRPDGASSSRALRAPGTWEEVQKEQHRFASDDAAPDMTRIAASDWASRSQDSKIIDRLSPEELKLYREYFHPKPDTKITSEHRKVARKYEKLREQYGKRRHNGARESATKAGKVLEAVGFDITLGKDPSLAKVTQALREFNPESGIDTTGIQELVNSYDQKGTLTGIDFLTAEISSKVRQQNKNA